MNSYVAMEAAVSLSCYYPEIENPDDPMPIDDGLIKADLKKPTPQYARELGYQDYLTDIGNNLAAKPISYYNSLDFWLVTGQSSGELGWMPVDWITSQKKYKPDDRWGLGQYKYDSQYGLPRQAIFERG